MRSFAHLIACFGDGHLWPAPDRHRTAPHGIAPHGAAHHQITTEIDEVTMTSTFRGACCTLLPFTILIGAATASAQTSTQSKADSVAAAAKADSIAHAQPQKKHGFFSRITSAASQAAAVVQAKTGINAANALQGAALLAAKANPAMAMMQAMQAAQQLQATQAAQMAAGAVGGRANGIAGLGMGMATGAAQLQMMQRLQQMMGGAGMGAAAGVAPQNAELGALQLQMAQIATAASKGDPASMQQLMRFQGEMAAAMARMNALGVTQQQSALPAAMRAAIACATTGQGCTAGTR